MLILIQANLRVDIIKPKVSDPLTPHPSKLTEFVLLFIINLVSLHNYTPALNSARRPTAWRRKWTACLKFKPTNTYWSDSISYLSNALSILALGIAQSRQVAFYRASGLIEHEMVDIIAHLSVKQIIGTQKLTFMALNALWQTSSLLTESSNIVVQSSMSSPWLTCRGPGLFVLDPASSVTRAAAFNVAKVCSSALGSISFYHGNGYIYPTFRVTQGFLCSYDRDDRNAIPSRDISALRE